MATQIQKAVNVKLSVILVGAAIAVSGATLPASAQVQLPVNIDVNKTYDQINNAVRGHKQRPACVKAASEVAYSAVGQRYNVMVFNMSQNYSAQLPGANFHSIQCDGKSYGVWIFNHGTFTNKGDGGYINWAFQGNARRTGYQGHTVIFSPR